MDFPKKNLGKQDRLIRLFLALALLAYGIFASSWIALLISVFVFFEAANSWCIFYQIIGKSSCPIDQKGDKQEK